MKPIYLIVLLFSIAFPLIRSFEPKIHYSKKWIALFPSIVITGTFFVIWDVIFTKNGIWGFNADYLIGVHILNLPLEEWLFFIFVPFASLFIYECVSFFFPRIKTSKVVGTLSTAFSLVLLLLAIYHSGKSYTFWVFCFGGVFLAIIGFQNPKWLGKFWIAYLLHLIPFFIINGVLTGATTDSPIVWYDDTHNLSIRIVTIPIEDTIYALLLFLMNVTLFEYFRKHFMKTKR